MAGGILIIPDVHEEVAKVRRILKQFPNVLGRIWLGDFFDFFRSTEESTEETCELLNEILEGDDALCIGNHCNHYMFDNRNMRCSGFDHSRRIQIHSKVNVRRWRERAQLFHVRDDYYFSHAGFHPSLIPQGLEKEERLSWLMKRCQESVDRASAGEFPTFFRAGYSRGGDHPVGGPNWMDWSDFQEIPTMPQIVGHSKASKVRQKGDSYCIDTALRHVALLDNNVVTIVEVKNED